MIRGQKYQQYILGKDFNAVKRSSYWAIFALLNRMIFPFSQFAYIAEPMRCIYSLRHRVIEEYSDSFSNHLQTLHLFWYCRCTTWGGQRPTRGIGQFCTTWVVYDDWCMRVVYHMNGASHEWCITWVVHKKGYVINNNDNDIFRQYQTSLCRLIYMY